ncbi:hypothetical protein QYE76_036141 [Lolium multiflorum]|uniref:Uncharacterized protein n=1 Tax=Lolium multiflorum TaxID=4521 RepID=A0AAD8VPW4_LOLMU|nr:hypothetical protein QYE76_036141 [Lolium multiflorum]
MSMAARLSALRSAGRRQVSASTMGVRQVTGSHVLRIDGFTQLSKTVANNTEMRSGTFNVGGHEWCLACYPNGCSDRYKGYVSIFLQQASHETTGAATAKGQLSILDRDGMPSCTKHITERTFKGPPFGWGEIDFVKHQDLDKDKHLHDGCLTILCDVTVTEHYADDHVEVAASAAPPFDLRGKLAEAMWNIKKVDVEIEVGGETFPAHRWVLEAQSPVFKTELSLASTADMTTKLRIDDMDVEVFKALLRFMYTDSPPETSQLQEAAMAEKILVSADRYKLDKLKLICEKTLCQHIDMSSLAATLALAERHRCSVLTAACIKFLSSPGNLEAFIAADGIKQLKERCPSALLDLAVKN